MSPVIQDVLVGEGAEVVQLLHGLQHFATSLLPLAPGDLSRVSDVPLIVEGDTPADVLLSEVPLVGVFRDVLETVTA